MVRARRACSEAHRNIAPNEGSRIGPRDGQSRPRGVAWPGREPYIPGLGEAHLMPETYLTQCFNCLSEFDALEAVWCSCNPQHPTKVCPFCLGCFCAAGEPFKDNFWGRAPEALRRE